MSYVIGKNVPWNAAWSDEETYEIRPCRWVGGRRALWSPHQPGQGRPLFAKPHMVRQRRSIVEFRCSVCGEVAPLGDRWWFRLGSVIETGWFATTESPVHLDCAKHALSVCPHLRGRDHDLEPFPAGAQVISSIVGGPATERDFGVSVPPEGVFGALKFAWPVDPRRQPNISPKGGLG